MIVYILGGCAACAIVLIIMARRAPYGREIPGVGFVLDDEPADQIADCDPWLTAMDRRALDPSFHVQPNSSGVTQDHG